MSFGEVQVLRGNEEANTEVIAGFSRHPDEFMVAGLNSATPGISDVITSESSTVRSGATLGEFRQPCSCQQPSRFSLNWGIHYQ